jgi:succinate dehydrogenase/fumarate reductase flavoprotein subunit
MSLIMLTTGIILDVPETRSAVVSQLGGANAALNSTVNGVQITVRASSVIAVADSVDAFVVRALPMITV